MGPSGPWKIFIFSGIVWAFSFVFWTCKFTCEVSFNELKQASVVKLTVKLQKSNKATNLCSSFIQFSWYFPNQLTTNNCSFIVSKKQSWHRWAENFVSQKNISFSKFFPQFVRSLSRKNTFILWLTSYCTQAAQMYSQKFQTLQHCGPLWWCTVEYLLLYLFFESFL